MGEIPKYQQVADDLRRRLAAGEWEVGQPIDPIARLMSRYGCSISTVRGAQRVLADEGLLRARQGIGIYVEVIPDVPGHTTRETLLREIHAAQDLVVRLAARLGQIETRLAHPVGENDGY
jgi:DNA-binding GntR family transcriptional regulator